MQFDGVDRRGDRAGAVDHVGELLQRIATGDRAAFARVYDTLSARAFGVILRELQDRTAGEEVLQQVFLEIWWSAGRFAASGEQGRAWVLALARRRAGERSNAGADAASATPSTESPESVAPPLTMRSTLLARIHYLPQGEDARDIPPRPPLPPTVPSVPASPAVTSVPVVPVVPPMPTAPPVPAVPSAPAEAVVPPLPVAPPVPVVPAADESPVESEAIAEPAPDDVADETAVIEAPGEPEYEPEPVANEHEFGVDPEGEAGLAESGREVEPESDSDSDSDSELGFDPEFAPAPQPVEFEPVGVPLVPAPDDEHPTLDAPIDADADADAAVDVPVTTETLTFTGLIQRIEEPEPPRAEATEPPTTTAAIQAVSRRNWTRGLLILAASLVVLVVLGFAAVRVNEWTHRPPSVIALQEIESAPDSRSETVEVLDGGIATAHWSSALASAVLVTDGLPAIADGETFELWFVREDGTHDSAGTFEADAPKMTVLLDGDLVEGDTIILTVEAAGGAGDGEPTGEPIVSIPTD